MDKKVLETLEECIANLANDEDDADFRDDFCCECDSCEAEELSRLYEKEIDEYRTTIEVLSAIIADLRTQLSLVSD